MASNKNEQTQVLLRELHSSQVPVARYKHLLAELEKIGPGAAAVFRHEQAEQALADLAQELRESG